MSKDIVDEEMNKEVKEGDVQGQVAYTARKRWLFLGLPFTFTKYTVRDDVLTIDSGFFTRNENDCYMYKIQDVQFSASLLERIVGLGTIICYTGDTTDPKLELKHIKHAKEIKNYILDASEKARIRRRTMNMLNIGTMTDEMDPADFV